MLDSEFHNQKSPGFKFNCPSPSIFQVESEGVEAIHKCSKLISLEILERFPTNPAYEVPILKNLPVSFFWSIEPIAVVFGHIDATILKVFGKFFENHFKYIKFK